MTWDEARSRRLARSHLQRAPEDRLVEVVRDVCGIHAQVMGSAELQLSARKTAKRIELTVEPARKLARDEWEGIGAEAERIGAFLGLEPTLSIA